jgi:enamine deaminase RidA (YjgF/YER057c/UK114 family)
MPHPTPRFIDPPTLSRPTGYSHVAEVPAGYVMVFIAGQVALDSTGALVGPGDFAAQTRQVFENLRRALAASGATFADVVKMTTFVTDASKTPVLREIRANYLDMNAPPPNTLVEVRRLARDEWLIEIEAIAAVRRAP